ncbi:MAG TPA: chemotaxis protein CheW [Planctomycetota bacterium]|nr:chemotaxis protein CheW [Planctomycetota bacterium]HRU51105.1 chemotaxis protein CheW [Planctomycetota bacterium]
MTIQLVTFQVGNHHLAIPIDKVQEVIRYTPVMESPEWSGLLHGIIHVRNIVIPVLDLRKVLAQDPIINNKKTRIIIVEILERVAGLIVDYVNDILPLFPEQIVHLSSITWEKKTAILASIANIDNQMYFVLDIDYLLRENEQKLFKEIFDSSFNVQ